MGKAAILKGKKSRAAGASLRKDPSPLERAVDRFHAALERKVSHRKAWTLRDLIRLCALRVLQHRREWRRAESWWRLVESGKHHQTDSYLCAQSNATTIARDRARACITAYRIVRKYLGGYAKEGIAWTHFPGFAPYLLFRGRSKTFGLGDVENSHWEDELLKLCRVRRIHPPELAGWKWSEGIRRLKPEHLKLPKVAPGVELKEVLLSLRFLSHLDGIWPIEFLNEWRSLHPLGPGPRGILGP